MKILWSALLHRATIMKTLSAVSLRMYGHFSCAAKIAIFKTQNPTFYFREEPDDVRRRWNCLFRNAFIVYIFKNYYFISWTVDLNFTCVTGQIATFSLYCVVGPVFRLRMRKIGPLVSTSYKFRCIVYVGLISHVGIRIL